MKKPRILMTSVGGLVAPSMIEHLRESARDNVYIVGVDADAGAVGFHFVDKNYVVPRGDDKGYSAQLLKIAAREHINVVLPLSDEELLSLAKDKAGFEQRGICIACSDYETVRTASDKGLMLQFLKKAGLPCPEFRVPRTLQELKHDIRGLGYPKKKVVFKPRKGRGARGFWLLNAAMDKRQMILKSRDRQEITLEWLLEALGAGDKFPEALVMEYLPGSDFNVDVLAMRGEPLYIIPNERLVPKAGPVQVGLVREDKKVREVVRDTVRAFGFDYYVNVEAAYRAGQHAQPFVYEINPRVSAPIVVNKAAGVDLMMCGIRLALGEKINTGFTIKKTKMLRYWKEIFING